MINVIDCYIFYIFSVFFLANNVVFWIHNIHTQTLKLMKTLNTAQQIWSLLQLMLLIGTLLLLFFAVKDFTKKRNSSIGLSLQTEVVDTV